MGDEVALEFVVLGAGDPQLGAAANLDGAAAPTVRRRRSAELRGLCGETRQLRAGREIPKKGPRLVRTKDGHDGGEIFELVKADQAVHRVVTTFRARGSQRWMLRLAAARHVDRGWTPLDLAARHNENAAVLEVLIAAVADPESKDNDVWTLLHSAGYENGAVLEALLAAGADPKTQANGDWTLLHMAARHNQDLAITQALIAAGADPKRGTTTARRPCTKPEATKTRP